jgi:hypothetical protein
MRKQPYSVMLTYMGHEGDPCDFYEFVYADSPKDAVAKALRILAAGTAEYPNDDDSITEEARDYLLNRQLVASLVLPGHIMGLDPKSEERY